MDMAYAGHYVDPTTDFGFKKLFAYPRLLLAFVNAVIPPADSAVEISLINTEVSGDAADKRRVIYNLRCLTSDGRTIIVEVQRLHTPYFKERTLYYAMRTFSAQVEIGDRYYDLKPVYLIALIDFALLGIDGITPYEGYAHHFRLYDERGELFSNGLQLYFVELNKMIIPVVTDEKSPVIATPLDQWALVLRNMGSMAKIPQSVTDEHVRRAFGVMEVAGPSAEDRERWQRMIDEDRDLQEAIKYKLEVQKAESLDEALNKALSRVGMNKQPRLQGRCWRQACLSKPLPPCSKDQFWSLISC